MNEVQSLVRRLESSMKQSFDKIQLIPDQYLDQPCRHGCARGGNVWHLLTHNIEHERMHAGQIIGLRDNINRLQQDRISRLLADLYLSRAALIASLLGLEDADLERSPTDGGWSIRQIVEHVLYWDRDSIDDLEAEFNEHQVIEKI